jgi:hypothetical protein
MAAGALRRRGLRHFFDRNVGRTPRCFDGWLRLDAGRRALRRIGLRLRLFEGSTIRPQLER